MSEKIENANLQDSPRQVKLAVARVDPWSIMKVSFLLSVALGIIMVIAVTVLWLILDSMHVFSGIADFMTLAGAERYVAILDYVKLSKVVAYTTIASVANVALMTAWATLGAFLYNVLASLVGGVRVHLMDE